MSRYGEALCRARTVLLIDDCDDDRLLFREACEGLNVELLEAESGRDGLALLKERPDVDLVLVDAQMPKMCGLDVYNEIREQGDRREIVFWTGHPDKLVSKLRDVGCAQIIPKPLSICRKYVHDMLGQFGVREQLHEIATA